MRRITPCRTVAQPQPPFFYRHGSTERTLTTREGTRAITVPRARLHTADGGGQEFQSTVVPRYARRTREVDEALLRCYFAWSPASKITFTSWQQRPLTDARYPMLFLDAIHLRVRLAGRVINVPVLAALGVTDDGQKQLVTLPLAAAEATASWGGLTQASFSTEAAALTVPFGLVAVGQIVFRKIDGHHDLAAFLVKEQWSQAA